MAPEYACFFVDSQWLPATGSTRTVVVDPSTEEALAELVDASEQDVARAVEAANRAFPAWSMIAATERAKYLRDIGDAIEANGDALASTISRDVGTPIAQCHPLHIDSAARMFKRTAELAIELASEEQVGGSVVYRRPLGVVGCITPWNYPLYQLACKLAPALAAGSTVVLKPSEVAPLSVFTFAEIARDIGLPPGVINVVFGPGVSVGEPLVTHPFVRQVSFTGSTETGRRIASLAGSSLKPVSLELGGKSPTVVLRDGDLEGAVETTSAKLYQNAGQTCAAFTRLLVPRKELRRAETLATTIAERLKIGVATDSDTSLGPLASQSQWRHVISLIQSGIDQGARLITGGPNRPEGYSRGYFVQPSVFSNVTPGMRIAQEEIFGPVLVVMPYGSEDEALELANGTAYGLSAAVWAADPDRASRFAQRIVAGSVSINGTPTNQDAPFGGFLDSGFGRERGRFAIEEFLTTQAVHLP